MMKVLLKKFFCFCSGRFRRLEFCRHIKFICRGRNYGRHDCRTIEKCCRFKVLPFLYIIFLVFLRQALPPLFSQEINQDRSIQLHLWAELDAYPENYTDENEKYSLEDSFLYPIKRIKELAPYLLEGMVYGWDFVYVPSDKLRGVREYFEKNVIKPLDTGGRIVYKYPEIYDGKLRVWVEFNRTQEMLSYLRYWEAAEHDKMHGSGRAPLKNGFDGIGEACDNALKNAVREYFRTKVKNKPKEIRGRVLIQRQPRITTGSGQYVVDLDFFVETIRIIPYSRF